jgi:hypothetical protein
LAAKHFQRDARHGKMFADEPICLGKQPTVMKPLMRLAAMIACAMILLGLGVVPSHAEKRVALVIGNGAYERADKLANPVTDSRRVRNSLSKLGFEVVYGENLAKQPLERIIGRFANTVQDADVALVYFAGHGATFGDIPYVVPVDAQFVSLGEVPYELVPVETLIGELRRAKGLRIAILDACRDDTAERELKRLATRGGEITRGLGRIKNPEGLILAYATQYLSTAADGDPNGDSPFTSALLNHIVTPGLDVKDVFFRVGSEVTATTRGKQRPEISVSFYDSYSLVSAGATPANAALGASSTTSLLPGQPGQVSAVVQNPIPPPVDAAAERAWVEVKGSTNIAVLEAFVRRFANSFYAELATARIEALRKAQADVTRQARSLPECVKLWIERNQVFKNFRYCFKTRAAIEYFGNAGCVYNDQDSVPIPQAQKAHVSQILARERTLRCQIDTNRPIQTYYGSTSR